MDVEYFSTLSEARASTKLQRYDTFLRWSVDGTPAIRQAFREASGHLQNLYLVASQNCDDIASEIIRAAGIQFDDAWRPVYSLENNGNDVDEIGNWYFPYVPSNNN